MLRAGLTFSITVGFPLSITESFEIGRSFEFKANYQIGQTGCYLAGAIPLSLHLPSYSKNRNPAALGCIQLLLPSRLYPVVYCVPGAGCCIAGSSGIQAGGEIGVSKGLAISAVKKYSDIAGTAALPLKQYKHNANFPGFMQHCNGWIQERTGDSMTVAAQGDICKLFALPCKVRQCKHPHIDGIVKYNMCCFTHHTPAMHAYHGTTAGAIWRHHLQQRRRRNGEKLGRMQAHLYR